MSLLLETARNTTVCTVSPEVTLICKTLTMQSINEDRQKLQQGNGDVEKLLSSYAHRQFFSSCEPELHFCRKVVLIGKKNKIKLKTSFSRRDWKTHAWLQVLVIQTVIANLT